MKFNINDHLPFMCEVLRALKHDQSLEEILPAILNHACLLVGAEHGSLAKVNRNKGRLEISSVFGDGWTDEKRAYSLKIGQGLTGRAAETGLPVLCGDVSAEPLYYPLFEQVQSALIVPILVSEKVWGVISLDGLVKNAFNEGKESLLTVFAELVGFCIHHKLEMEKHARIQQELAQADRLSSLAKTIAGIAHELNNPLTSVFGHAQLLSLDPTLDPQREMSVKAILSESERAANLVKRLLSFARQETSRKEPVSLNQIVTEVVESLEKSCKEMNMQLFGVLSDDPCCVMANPKEIKQVLATLINNARDALAGRESNRCIIVKTEVQDCLARILVEDNGEGISDDNKKRIFDPFFTTKPVGQGTGLGLAFVHSIAKSHRGTITFNSELGNGSCFKFEMATFSEDKENILHKETPADTCAPSEPDKCATNAFTTYQNIRLLLVDDEPFILNSLAEYLSLLEMSVATASDGYEALAHIRNEEFDLIVTDLRMPGMDGQQLYQSACASYSSLSKRFVFMTGDLARTETRIFLDSTKCICLEKPFPFSDLKDAIVKSVTH